MAYEGMIAETISIPGDKSVIRCDRIAPGRIDKSPSPARAGEGLASPDSECDWL